MSSEKVKHIASSEDMQIAITQATIQAITVVVRGNEGGRPAN